LYSGKLITDLMATVESAEQAAASRLAGEN